MICVIMVGARGGGSGACNWSRGDHLMEPPVVLLLLLRQVYLFFTGMIP